MNRTTNRTPKNLGRVLATTLLAPTTAILLATSLAAPGHAATAPDLAHSPAAQKSALADALDGTTLATALDLDPTGANPSVGGLAADAAESLLAESSRHKPGKPNKPGAKGGKKGHHGSKHGGKHGSKGGKKGHHGSKGGKGKHGPKHGPKHGGKHQPPRHPAPQPQTSSLRERALNVAVAQSGDPYVYGAAGPNSFDCSGLTSFAYAAAGRAIPRTSSAQRAAFAVIPAAQRQRGDLVFFHGDSGVYHVGIYLGDNMIIHAPSSGSVVRREAIWTSAVSYGRVG